ncbi:hypothetical protein [Actinoplanes sp. NPDC051859]|uniref:hypothetical protein n=1 Tax=Actinoplanes sp. NPDC051859 TaxID=3363909 RepID=UPI003796D3D7
MGIFKKDPELGMKAYQEARRMRADLRTKTPKPTKDELHVIVASTGRLTHNSARHN